VGDTILQACGKELVNLEDLSNELKGRVGEVCPITVERDGHLYMFQVRERERERE